MLKTAWGLAKTGTVATGALFVVGAATGPAGWGVLSTYFGTVGAGLNSTLSGAGQAATWAAGFAPAPAA